MNVGLLGDVPKSVRDTLTTLGNLVVYLPEDYLGLGRTIDFILAEGKNLGPDIGKLRDGGVPVFCSSPEAEFLMLSRLAMHQAMRGAHVRGLSMGSV